MKNLIATLRALLSVASSRIPVEPFECTTCRRTTTRLTRTQYRTWNDTGIAPCGCGQPMWPERVLARTRQAANEEASVRP